MTQMLYAKVGLAPLFHSYQISRLSSSYLSYIESTNEVELFGRVISDLEDGGYLSFHLRANKTLP